MLVSQEALSTVATNFHNIDDGEQNLSVKAEIIIMSPLSYILQSNLGN